jgi:hypothetical protein
VPAAADVAPSGVSGRWQTLLEKLKEIADQSGEHDFRVVGQDSFLYCFDGYQQFEFRVRSPQWGADNRWDGTRGVSFSLPRGNMVDPAYSTIRGTRPTHLYLLGPSADDERTVEEYADAAAQAESPWNRIEAVADAQAVEAASARQSIAAAELEERGPYKDLEFQVQET